MAYIKKEPIVEFITKGLNNPDKTKAYGYDAVEILTEIEYTLTADVVEVVRCKDCSYYIEMKGFDYNGRKAKSCVLHSALRGENDYCSDAIRTSKRTPKERGGEK